MAKEISLTSISKEATLKLEDLSIVLLIASFAMPIRQMSMSILAFVVVNAFKAVLGRAHLRGVSLSRGQQAVGFAFALYFAIYALSLLWSYDFEYGVSRLETRSNFLTLPLVFILFKVRVRNLKLVLTSLVWTTTITMVACFVVAFAYAYSYNDLQTPFRYYNFGFWLGFHPGYLSLLLVLSLLSILELAKQKSGFSWLLMLIALFQSFSIVFIGARIALALLVLIMIMATYDFLAVEKIRFLRRRVILASGVAAVVAFVGLLSSANTRERLIDSNESLKARLRIYVVSLDLIKERPLLGYGMGGDREVLAAEYERRGMYDEAEGRYNAHNQFLQTLLEVGVIGLATLAILLFTVIKQSRNKRLIWRIYVIFCLFFLIESGLQRLQGIIPFVVLSLVFCFIAQNATNRKEIDQSTT
jgi:Lipid A core - O-antigen ligase and related enzymes